MKIKDYICSPSAFQGGKYSIISWSILGLWLAVVLFVSYHHEMWRDEAHCLYVALSADSLWQLPDAVKNEGHPIIWYLILWLGYQAVHTPVILKIVSIAVGFIAVLIFYRSSPFPVWFKVLFLLSFLPFYEYTVMARNYGISMLLFFWFASLYNKKHEKPFMLAFVLLLLANTNIHSTIFVCLLVVFWIYEVVFIEKYSNKRLSYAKQLIFPLGLVFLGVLFAILTVIPDRNSIVLQTSGVSISSVLSAFFQTIIHPGNYYNEVFAGLPPIARDLLIFVFAAGLLVSPMAGFLLFVGAVGLGLFFSIGYSGALRHQGIFFLYVITLYWIVCLKIREKKDFVPFFMPIFKVVLYGIIQIVLSVHIFGSYKYIVRDVTKKMSSSKDFGVFLQENKQFHDAIIMGEPDIRLESLPYYAKNRIFVPRNNKFANFIKLTRENKQDLSLGELHALARSLSVKEQKPVLIALGHFGLSEQNPPFVRHEQYNRTFSWTAEELKWFRDDTVKVAEFKEDVKNERYEVYLLQ
ncbi:MAG TPA: hypothetical protein DEG92_02630 [Rikenellaceae bacterium]|nr:hypothetical protein [Rikenellaceae bacterium]